MKGSEMEKSSDFESKPVEMFYVKVAEESFFLGDAYAVMGMDPDEILRVAAMWDEGVLEWAKKTSIGGGFWEPYASVQKEEYESYSEYPYLNERYVSDPDLGVLQYDDTPRINGWVPESSLDETIAMAAEKIRGYLLKAYDIKMAE